MSSIPYFNAHTHQVNASEQVISLVNQYPEEFNENISFCSAGIHPWHSYDKELHTRMHALEKWAVLPQVKAIGECGLDKRIDVSIQHQIEVFDFQISLALRVQKPLIIHCVGAFDQLMARLKEKRFDLPVIIHGFSKNAALAEQLIRKGYYLTFGKYLFLQPSTGVAFAKAPLSHILLETDNSDYRIEEVYQKAAELKQMDLVDLQRKIIENTKQIFGNYCEMAGTSGTAL